MKWLACLLVAAPTFALAAAPVCPKVDGKYTSCKETVVPAEMAGAFGVPETVEVTTKTINGQTVVMVVRDGEVVDPENTEATAGNVFRPGAPKLVLPVNDAGIKSIQVEDTCESDKIVKRVRTELDPTKPLEFPVVDADIQVGTDSANGDLLLMLAAPTSVQPEVFQLLRCSKVTN